MAIPIPQLQQLRLGDPIGSFQQGRTTGLQQQAIQAQTQGVLQQQQQAQQERTIMQLASTGDPQALQVLSSINPQAAEGIRKNQEARTTRAAQIAKAVLKAPESVKQMAYDNGLKQARLEGLDISALPAEWSPEAEPFLQFIVDSASDLEESFKPLETAQGLQLLETGTGRITPAISEGQQLQPPIKEEDVTKKEAATFKKTTDLRKEFTRNSGEFIKSRDAFNRVQASAQDPSAAGDLALIFNFMKVLDPGSTVREGEFATAQNSAAVSEAIRAKYNKVITGERLSDKTRNDFVSRAGKLFAKATNSQERRVKQFTAIAKRNKLPVEDVILNLIEEPLDQQQPTQPKVRRFNPQTGRIE